MPRYILKLAADEYVEWSTIVDAPVTYACDRAEAVREWGEDCVVRADEHVTSMMDRMYWDDDAASAVAFNRAGPGETRLTLAQIREQYSAEAGERYARDNALITGDMET